MISPRPFFILLAGLLLVPACAIATLAPSWNAACLLVVCAVVASAACDALLGQRRLAAVQVSAPLSLKWFKGRTAELEVSVPEGGPMEASLELPPGLESGLRVACIAAGQTVVRFPCTARERGRYTLKLLHLRALSPWWLWNIRAAKSIHSEIRVFPDIEREPGAKLLLLKKMGGLRSQRTVGRGREFERLREYAPGDSYDEIAWKASARRGRPIVRVFQVERTQDVFAVIDSSRLGARGAAVEQFVSAALMLALAAENNGDNFGLVSFSDRVDHFVPPARGKLHFARCRDAIFDLKPRPVSADFAELFAFLQLRIRRRSLLLFLTDLADPLLAETFLRDVHLLSRRHLVIVNRLSDEQVRPLFSGPLPETGDEIAERLAGHLQWANLDDLEKSLRRLGVRMSLLTAGAAGLDLVRQYNAVKARQVL